MSITLHLPTPPSVNDMYGYGRGRVYKSKLYKDWILRADICVLQAHALRGHKTIKGKFDAEIILDSGDKADEDNRVKCLLDFAQRLEIISNDKNSRNINISKGFAPTGCILTIKEAA